MAVTSKDISAKLQLTDSKMKIIATYSGVKPDVDANAVAEFALALEMLTSKNFGFKYLVIDSELENTL